ncbi:LPXTG cell wall anchor domain-containing protein [Dactylosporangium sp. NBC_01737]|uniref:LPXTG cell wall anchor domain-containing protein n=1 Tax=Dactylosporangium sp. NBC_01737 TaxID=2975959 RepID=UPI002E0D9083|nr:LPXTG cell wall anchor domain-containing protein [Dactylosporangium sp. NBC_01737]
MPHRLPLRRLPRVLVPAGAALAALLAAAPAAASITLPLHTAHRGATATGFGTHSCDQIPRQYRGAGVDGFVFVLPGNDADFVSLTLKFRPTGGGEVTVHVADPSDAYPDGIVEDNGASKAWVVVPSGWKLLDGTAVVDNDRTRADDFNLTHTCPGGGASPSPSPSRSASASPSPSVSTGGSSSPAPNDSGSVEGSSSVPSNPATATPGGGGSGGGSLPVTGVALTSMTVTAAGLIAAGVGLLMVRRRREATFVADGPASAAGDDGSEPTPHA